MSNNYTPQPWAPQRSNPQQVLPEPPNHPFYYKWHPSNWMFHYFDVEVKSGKSTKIEKKGFFLPNIRMEYVVPGVNGIHQISGELGNPGSRIGKLQQDGWVYLNPERFQYINVYPVRGGRYHSPIWESVRTVGNRVIKKFDSDAFRKWSAKLVLDGTLSPIESHFWELQTITHQKTIDRLAASQHIPEVKIEMNQAYKIKDDMIECMQRFELNGIEIYRELF